MSANRSHEGPERDPDGILGLRLASTSTSPVVRSMSPCRWRRDERYADRYCGRPSTAVYVKQADPRVDTDRTEVVPLCAAHASAWSRRGYAVLTLSGDPWVAPPRPLVVGEAPSRTNDGGAAGKKGPLDGPGGAWIAELMSDVLEGVCLSDVLYRSYPRRVVSLDEFLDAFERINLFDSYADVRNGWPTLDARTRADALMDERLDSKDWTGRIVVLLGRNVADAFRVPAGVPLFQFVWLSGDVRRVVVPHPSKRSRWWNEPENVKRARQFWKELRKEVLD